MLQVHIFDEKDSNPRTEVEEDSTNPDQHADEDIDGLFDDGEIQDEDQEAEDKNVSGTN